MANTCSKRLGRFGFTLIELMITVSIIGILASIAIPKFADLIRKSREGTLKGNLGALRSALNIYYADMEGWYPELDCGGSQCSSSGILAYALTVNGKYLATIPVPYIPDYHTNTADLQNPEFDISGPGYYSTYISYDGAGCTAWLYGADYTQPTWGTVVVFCSHTDTKGTVWTSY